MKQAVSLLVKSQNNFQELVGALFYIKNGQVCQRMQAKAIKKAEEKQTNNEQKTSEKQSYTVYEDEHTQTDTESYRSPFMQAKRGFTMKRNFSHNNLKKMNLTS